MVTTDRSEHQRLTWIVAGILIVIAFGWAWGRWQIPPQIGTSEEVFKTVDALFTAITSRDTRQLGECEQRLQTFREAGTLPLQAARDLNSVIQQARDGKWDASAHRLYDIMLGQRRG
jgi:hypothetical protein